MLSMINTAYNNINIYLNIDELSLITQRKIKSAGLDCFTMQICG